MVEPIRTFYNYLISFGNSIQPLVLLAIRLFWGFLFATAGFGKLEDISSVTQYFSGLGIPMPIVSAYAVALIESIGGMCLIAGFATRLVCLPLVITMLNAIFVAHKDVVQAALQDPFALTKLEAFSLLVATLTIFSFGPGAISLDGILKRFAGKN